MKIYVASSWRNLLQPGIVMALRRCGHDVYDFRHPAPGDDGFSWREIHPNWRHWTPAQYREALQHPIAARGYAHDITALRACDACVLVLPSDRSASWEFGYAMGMGKKGYVVLFEPCEPELMYREATIITHLDELFDALGEPRERPSLTQDEMMQYGHPLFAQPMFAAPPQHCLGSACEQTNVSGASSVCTCRCDSCVLVRERQRERT